jgi:hypothetical protein
MDQLIIKELGTRTVDDELHVVADVYEKAQPTNMAQIPRPCAGRREHWVLQGGPAVQYASPRRRPRAGRRGTRGAGGGGLEQHAEQAGDKAPEEDSRPAP